MATAILYPQIQWFDSNGDPLASGSIVTYAAGTTDSQLAYQDSSASVAHSATITLDSAGIAELFLDTSLPDYKFVIKDSGGNTVQTIDNINLASTLASQTNGRVYLGTLDLSSTVFTADGLAGYSVYEIVLDAVVTTTAGSEVAVQLYDNEVLVTSGYDWIAQDITTGGAESTGGSTSDSHIQLENGTDGTPFQAHIVMWENGTLTSNGAGFDGSSNLERCTAAGSYAIATSLTGFKMVTTSGGFDSGKAHYYGVYTGA